MDSVKRKGKHVTQKAPFTFRQRVGAMNWKLVTSIKIDDIIDESNVEDLQSILDSIAFCEFKSTDVRNNTEESVQTVVRLMQLMIEYLLHCQESQYSIIEALHSRNSSLKHSLKICTRQMVALKEDTKIYQKQLSIMRQSLIKMQKVMKDGGVWKHMDREIMDPLGNFSNSKNKDDDILGARDLILTILQEQRESNTRQFNEFLSSMQSQSSNIESRSNWVNDFQKNVERMLQSALSAIETTTVKTVDTISAVKITPNRHSFRNSSISLTDISLSKQSKLAAELERREKDLRSREQYCDQLKARLEHELENSNVADHKRPPPIIRLTSTISAESGSQMTKNRKDEATEISQPIISSSTTAQVYSDIESQSDSLELTKIFAARFWYYSLLHAHRNFVLRQKFRVFQLWFKLTVDLREEYLHAEYSSQIESISAMYQRQESELRSHLKEERDKVIIEQARFKSLSRKTQDDIVREREAAQRKVDSLIAAEEERKAQLASRLVDSSVMTSIDFGTMAGVWKAGAGKYMSSFGGSAGKLSVGTSIGNEFSTRSSFGSGTGKLLVGTSVGVGTSTGNDFPTRSTSPTHSSSSTSPVPLATATTPMQTQTDVMAPASLSASTPTPLPIAAPPQMLPSVSTSVQDLDLPSMPKPSPEPIPRLHILGTSINSDTTEDNLIDILENQIATSKGAKGDRSDISVTASSRLAQEISQRLSSRLKQRQ